ncbi:nucleolar protein 4-like isoform X1 [Crassostrea angulata]|uniref:nucleolar protein 4-like isoform X1 n=1 Tax=Magallana angulata TaxID=2784310 RepID=UPI00148A906A|nr:nucleolar protein 4 isoform X1 [Crassostrea gigas]XP_052687771.1 nucleolar protein 4-like isoform X1 [Crassostrea angulata]
MSSAARAVDSSRCSINKQEMFETFQTWALQNYGDSGKTKTVTHKKHDRIVKILTGEEPSTADNSKFRFWVKAKGFRLGPSVNKDGCDRTIYVPTKHVTDPNCNDTDKDYKKVAKVEEFFDIIYSVHVDMDGRGGKHAGQKRTYRAIAETYAFLPREAVTRFLMSCSDCQKRMHVTSTEETHSNASCESSYKPEASIEDPPIIDFSVPITQTYLNHMKQKGMAMDTGVTDEESMSSVDSTAESRDGSPALSDDTTTNNRSTPKEDSPMADEDTSLTFPMSKSPSTRSEDRGHPERKRRASEDSCESSTKLSEGGNNEESVCKDEDDDDDNDDDDKMPAGQDFDPERLKAFNMFVRLFVDENLDRMVPISKQPKDKIQAILEACDRQFPEFHIRSRKRIRTYLKSCRRMRRSKEQNGWEPQQMRPTPPHLTSAAAESLLAQACENESQNAKRMRLGLEPLPAASMHTNSSTTNSQSQTTAQQQQQQSTPAPSPHSQSSSNQTSPQSQQSASQVDRHAHTNNDFLRHQPPPPTFRPAPEFHPPFFTNGNGLFRPGFPGYQHPAHHHPPVLSHGALNPTSVQNGKLSPTDLSMKKQSSKSQLSAGEIATIKQLIGGYRESAAFLYRSADELEQLLLQQN